MKYLELAKTYDKLSGTTKRLEKIEILSEFLKKVPKEEAYLLYLIEGNIYPDYDERKLGISNQLAIKSISKATGTSPEKVLSKWKKIGDIGEVAKELISKKTQSTLHTKTLTTKKVIENLKKLSEFEGKGTVTKKIQLITELLTSANSLEALYITRTLIGDLRIGVQESTIKYSIIKAFFKDKEKAEPIVQKAIDRSNDLAEVFEICLSKNLKKLEKIKLEVGKPIKAMLAQKTPTIEEAFRQLGKPMAIEYKYDGFRCITGNTPIYVKSKGILSVKNVRIGDYVLTHKGKFRKVLALNKRKIDKKEKLYKIQSYLGNEFRITEKHKILVLKNKKIVWIPPEKISKKDKLAFPLYKKKRGKKIEKTICLKDESGYKKNFSMNNFFFRFLGYWIGDGFTNNYHNTERVGIIFNQKKEKKLCEYYKKEIKKNFKISNLSKNIHNGAIYLYWRDKPFRIWLSKNFRREWKGKMIPDFLFNASERQFNEFLKGWIESDGHEDKKGRINITTKERDMAMKIQLLGFRFNKILGIKRLFINKQQYFKIIIPKTKKTFQIEKKYVFFKILHKNEIKKPDPRINLYNLQVEGDESYCTTMATLHNCLIHKKDEKVLIFTRRLENVTKQFPEVEEYIKKYIKGESFILDSEAVGYDKKTGQYTDFQKISQRIRRKYNISELQKKLPIEINVFDIIYYNGKSQIEKPFIERRELIEKIITPNPYKLIYSKYKTTSDKKEVEKFYKKALENNQEGIMMKNLHAEYKPGRRVGHMLKLKPETNELDLVITGAEWGTGKRKGWLSSFILSCKKDKEYLEIGKVGTGISELENENNKVTFKKLTELIKPLIIKEKGKNVSIKPKIIVTVHYQDLQRSPNYQSGWALRFPRITALREDKPLNEIASLEEIKEDFKTSKHQSWRYG